MKNGFQGSFTVEAAMIMGIVLLVIVSVIEGSSMIHNRAVEAASQYEQELLKKQYDPDPIEYARTVQAVKDLTVE